MRSWAGREPRLPWKNVLSRFYTPPPKLCSKSETSFDKFRDIQDCDGVIFLSVNSAQLRNTLLKDNSSLPLLSIALNWDLSRPHPLQHTDTHSHTLTLTHRHTLTDSHTHTDSHSHTDTHTETHSHTLTHTKTHRETHIHTHTITHGDIQSQHTDTHTYTHTHTHRDTCSHAQM